MSSTPPHSSHPGQPSNPNPVVSQAKPMEQSSKFGGLIRYMVRGRRRPGEVTVVSHSDLFYWWPVWLVGFIMSIITYAHGVHAGFISGRPKVIDITEGSEIRYEVKEGPEREKLKKDRPAIISNDLENPFPMSKHGAHEDYTWPYMHNSKNLGAFFCVTLLLVIFITNVHLRGLWSLIVILIIVLGSVIFALAGTWQWIFENWASLAIHINLGAYLSFSLVLFAAWLINFALFDRQRYVSVSSGQVRLHMAIGEGEIVYDTTGMVFQKKRSDLFRHWILGFGSGDLEIRPANQKDPIDLPNVLFVGHKVQEIQDLIREKEVVSS